MRTFMRLIAVASTFGLVAGAAACSDDDTTSNPSPTPAPTTAPTNTPPAAGGAKLRVVHASPDAPAVDVWVKGIDAPIVSGAKYGDASPYIDVPEGTYTIELRAAPSKATDPIAFSVEGVTVPKDAKITAIAAGFLASKDGADQLRIIPLAEKFDPAGDKAQVRIVHASADAPTVGIDVGNDDPAAPEVPALERFKDTGAAGVGLPAGQPLQVGIVAGGARVTAFTTPALPAGGELFIIATGRLGKLPREADGFSLLAVGPTGAIGFIKQNPTVYALHACADAPAVDIFAGPAELADNLAFGGISKPIQVPPGSYTLDIFAHAAGSARPAGDPVSAQPTGALAAGERYLAVAKGLLAGNPAFGLAAFADEFDTKDAARGRLRVVHASPDAPAVDIGVVNGQAISPVLIPGLVPDAATGGAGLGVDPSTYTLGVTPMGQNNTIVNSFTVPVAAGHRVFVVAAGALDTNKGQGFRLLAVDTVASPWAVATINGNN